MTQPTDDGIAEARQVLAAARDEGVISDAYHAAADAMLDRMGAVVADIEALGAGAQVRVSIDVTVRGMD